MNWWAAVVLSNFLSGRLPKEVTVSTSVFLLDQQPWMVDVFVKHQDWEEQIQFTEQFEKFPSDLLLTQIILVAGK